MGYQLAPSGAATYDAYVNADPGQLTNRNLLHNGAMQVAQRGTSTASITTSGYYTADRWTVSMAGLGTWTQSVEADGPTGSGITKSLKMLCTTADAAPAASDSLRIDQYLEGQGVQRVAKGTASAQQLTLSFWVKSNTTGTYLAALYDADNTRTVSASYTVTASATWERKTITFPADTTGAFDNDNALSLQVRWWLGAGSDRTSGTLNTTWAAATTANLAVGQTNVAATINNYWQITGVQLEVGPVATPFEFKPYDMELRECQRYYWRSEAATTTDGLIGHGMAISTTVAEFSLPITMRTTPIAPIANSIRLWDGVTGTAVTATGINNSGPNMVIFNLTVASGLTQFRPYRVISNTLPSYIALSADL